MKVEPDEIAAVGQAVEILDHLWEWDAARGLRDSRGGAEYKRMSPAPTLNGLYRKLVEEMAAE